MREPTDSRVCRGVGTIAWCGVSVFLLLAVGMFVEGKVTYYLAAYQSGYLTFARDLQHGQVFHHWLPAEALAALLPPKTDVLTQTYVYDRGLLWCRYSPGSPLLLAGWRPLAPTRFTP